MHVHDKCTVTRYRKRLLLNKLCKTAKRRRIHHSKLHTDCCRPCCFYSLKDENLNVTRFRQWCSTVGIKLNKKIYIGHEGSCHEIGVVATNDIMKNEVIATIPRTAILTANNSNITRKLLEQDKSLVTTVTPWIPLLIALTVEYSQLNCSRWEPYLSIVPNNGDCPPPLLWEQSERDRLLRGTGVDYLVEQDLQRITKDYTTIVEPFYKRHVNVIPVEYHDQCIYEKSVSFVMSYSFTDDNGTDPLSVTMMVPFVDLLNHHDNHNAELSYHSNYLQLIAIKNIKKGDEIFNTFGQLPNYSLLHTYGFVLPNNDTACVLTEILRECYLSFTHKPDNAVMRWDRINKKDVIHDTYEVDGNGVPDNHLLRLIRLLLCKRFMLKLSYKWSMTFDSMNKQETALLTKFITSCISVYPQSLEYYQQLLLGSSRGSLISAGTKGCGSLISDSRKECGSSREKASLSVIIGSLNCLYKCLKLME